MTSYPGQCSVCYYLQPVLGATAVCPHCTATTTNNNIGSFPQLDPADAGFPLPRASYPIEGSSHQYTTPLRRKDPIPAAAAGSSQRNYRRVMTENAARTLDDSSTRPVQERRGGSGQQQIRFANAGFPLYNMASFASRPNQASSLQRRTPPRRQESVPAASARLSAAALDDCRTGSVQERLRRIQNSAENQRRLLKQSADTLAEMYPQQDQLHRTETSSPQNPIRARMRSRRLPTTRNADARHQQQNQGTGRNKRNKDTTNKKAENPNEDDDDEPVAVVAVNSLETVLQERFKVAEAKGEIVDLSAETEIAVAPSSLHLKTTIDSEGHEVICLDDDDDEGETTGHSAVEKQQTGKRHIAEEDSDIEVIEPKRRPIPCPKCNNPFDQQGSCASCLQRNMNGEKVKEKEQREEENLNLWDCFEANATGNRRGMQDLCTDDISASSHQLSENGSESSSEEDDFYGFFRSSRRRTKKSCTCSACGKSREQAGMCTSCWNQSETGEKPKEADFRQGEIVERISAARCVECGKIETADMRKDKYLCKSCLNDITIAASQDSLGDLNEENDGISFLLAAEF